MEGSRLLSCLEAKSWRESNSHDHLWWNELKPGGSTWGHQWQLNLNVKPFCWGCVRLLTFDLIQSVPARNQDFQNKTKWMYEEWACLVQLPFSSFLFVFSYFFSNIHVSTLVPSQRDLSRTVCPNCVELDKKAVFEQQHLNIYLLIWLKSDFNPEWPLLIRNKCVWLF